MRCPPYATNRAFIGRWNGLIRIMPLRKSTLERREAACDVALSPFTEDDEQLELAL